MRAVGVFSISCSVRSLRNPIQNSHGPVARATAATTGKFRSMALEAAAGPHQVGGPGEVEESAQTEQRAEAEPDHVPGRHPERARVDGAVGNPQELQMS